MLQSECWLGRTLFSLPHRPLLKCYLRKTRSTTFQTMISTMRGVAGGEYSERHDFVFRFWAVRLSQPSTNSLLRTANGVTGCRRSNLTTVTATCKSVQHSRYYYYLGARACQSEAHLQFLTRCAQPRPAHGRHGEPSRRVQHNAASSAGPTQRDSSSQKGGIHRLCIPATSLATLPLLECTTATHHRIPSDCQPRQCKRAPTATAIGEQRQPG